MTKLLILGILILILAIVYFVSGLPELGLVCLIPSIILISIYFIYRADNITTKYEYPASEYKLEYKITEYQGQQDTIYVLTKQL